MNSLSILKAWKPGHNKKELDSKYNPNYARRLRFYKSLKAVCTIGSIKLEVKLDFTDLNLIDRANKCPIEIIKVTQLDDHLRFRLRHFRD